MSTLRPIYRLLIAIGLVLAITFGMSGAAHAGTTPDPVDRLLQEVCSRVHSLDPVDDYLFCIKF